MYPSSSLVFGTALAFLLAVTAPALAQPAVGAVCHDHQALSRALQERYQEVPVSMGLQTDGQLVQIFASAETGTWTILATRPNGVSCILSAGKHFEQRSLDRASPAAKLEQDERTG